jgi:hypothetical protein
MWVLFETQSFVNKQFVFKPSTRAYKPNKSQTKKQRNEFLHVFVSDNGGGLYVPILCKIVFVPFNPYFTVERGKAGLGSWNVVQPQDLYRWMRAPPFDLLLLDEACCCCCCCMTRSFISKSKSFCCNCN